MAESPRKAAGEVKCGYVVGLCDVTHQVQFNTLPSYLDWLPPGTVESYSI